MTREMYHVGGACLSNEKLAERIKGGDNDAAALLLSQNEGFLSSGAAKLCGQYSRPNILDDLKQEGALALLAAAKTYDPSGGAKLLTYAAGVVRSAMLDYIAEKELPVRLPPSRCHQLRRVAHLCTTAAEEASEAELIEQICKSENVSIKTARSFLLDYRSISGAVSLDDPEISVGRGGDPAKVYDIFMRKKLLMQLMEQVLTARELNVVKYHLGLDQPDERGLTFAELAVRLNYKRAQRGGKSIQTGSQKAAGQLECRGVRRLACRRSCYP